MHVFGLLPTQGVAGRTSNQSPKTASSRCQRAFAVTAGGLLGGIQLTWNEACNAKSMRLCAGIHLIACASLIDPYYKPRLVPASNAPVNTA